MYKKILVPTDGSEFAKKAQLHALFLAKVSGAEIVALSVSENHFINGISATDEIEQLNQILTDRCEKDLKEFEDMNEDGIKISSVIKEGTPAKAILDVASEEAIDLIVSDKVVNAAKCPVLVVH